MNMPVSIESDIGLTDRDREQLEKLANAISAKDALWASGFLAGVAHARLRDSEVEGLESHSIKATPAADTMLTILYASETGNAAALAHRIETQALGLGIKAVARDLATYKPRFLKDERAIILISSTHGEGEPPEPAKGFFEFIRGRKAPKLDGMRFAVLALGDSTYEFFCEAAKVLDLRFEELGAKRFHERIDCDVDYDDVAETWIENALEKHRAELAKQSAGSDKISLTQATNASLLSAYDKHHPFAATVFDNLTLTGRGSTKETRHIEFSIDEHALQFSPGDALGILPRNDPDLINQILDQTEFTGSEVIALKKNDISLSEALAQNFEITTLTPKFLKNWAELTNTIELQALVEGNDRKALTTYLNENHIIDVITRYPAKGLEATQFVDGLRGLQPRLYSISSSKRAFPDEVHITVSSVRYALHDTMRKGVASCFLADRVKPGDVVPLYIQQNDHFRLPADESTPMIMIGAGTGIAPYRAFLQDQEMTGGGGKRWIIFGERNFLSDFLYQTEWQEWLRSGVLTQMDVAFSRDQIEKRYVQHAMRERGREVYRWLEEGAHLYVCGDAEKLAPDVNEMLIHIVETHGAMTRDGAEEYLRTMQSAGRYQRDVY